jgi:hypothetical protein
MARAWADVLQIVVLAADAHALLAGGGALVRPLFQSQEDILELVHAGIDQQQGRVVGRHQAAAGNRFMALFSKVVEPILANLVGREAFHLKRSIDHKLQKSKVAEWQGCRGHATARPRHSLYRPLG